MAWFVAHAQNCQTALLGRVDSEIGYKQRGSRCEGLTARPVSGSINLTLIGYQTGNTSYDFRNQDKLVVSVLGVDGRQKISLQATSLNPQVSYRMDTSDVDLHGQFVCPTDLLRLLLKQNQIYLAPSDIALLACSNRCEEKVSTKYWPVTIGAASPVQPSTLMLILDTTVELGSVGLHIRRGGKTVLNENVPGSYFAAHRSIPVTLPHLAPGDYDLAVSATAPDSRDPAGVLNVTVVVP
jgi:hypothetical protein